MGGFPSCMRIPEKEEEKTDSSNKPSQYEEIDDNFTVLPSAKTNGKSTTNNDVTTAPNSKNDDVNNDDSTYENVSKTTAQNNLRNYVPNMTRNARSEPVREVPNIIYSSTIQDGNADSSNPYDNRQSDTNAPENVYENCCVAPQLQPQSSPGEIQDGDDSDRLANRNPEKGVIVSEEMAPALKEKKNKGSRKKIKEPIAPPLKPKKNFLKAKNDPQKPTEEPPSSSSKDKKLTYIEVEFATPPSDTNNKNGGKRHPPTQPPTTYTDVVHEGGRLVLIR